MIITALNFFVIVVICLASGYLLGYHVRKTMEQQDPPRLDERFNSQKHIPYDKRI
ncbi:hypothetical protein [Solibacillus isronensis]|uniref:hypothetical protein n=1 Tax=Solibacillus isronensis TaxID=412383 RepID=UPI0039A2C7A3